MYYSTKSPVRKNSKMKMQHFLDDNLITRRVQAITRLNFQSRYKQVFLKPFI